MNANGRPTISAVIMSCPSTSVRSPISGTVAGHRGVDSSGHVFRQVLVKRRRRLLAFTNIALEQDGCRNDAAIGRKRASPGSARGQDIHDDRLSPHHAGFPRERIGAFGTDRPQPQSQGHTVVPDVQTAHSLLADATDAPSTHCLFEAHRSLMDPSVTCGRPCGWAIIHVEAIPTEYGPC